MSKKKGNSEPKAYLGRPGNNVCMGIVGMPNIGKSSLFNLLGNLQVAAENYPFCTIDPSLTKVVVPDARFDRLVEMYQPKSVVPAVLTVTDIAGLVKGAHEGKGLGNQFLSHISAVDAIYHVCRAFKDTSVEHVEGDVDPVRDLEVISNELLKKDLALMEKITGDLDKKCARQNDKALKEQLAIFKKILAYLEEGNDIRSGLDSEYWNGKDIIELNKLQLLTAKPVVYLINVSKKGYIKKANKFFRPIAEWVKKRSPGAKVIPFSIAFEEELNHMSEDEQKQFLEENKSQSALPKIVTTGYHALDLIHFFTSGADEVRAWTLRQGCLAPQAAGVIHTDFEKGFIKAETMNYDDLIELDDGSGVKAAEAAVKAAGKYNMQGKNYEVKDGDIIYFKFNT